MKKLIISAGALLKAMQQNSKCINKSTPLPVCEMYLMEVKGQALRIVTTDLEQSVINTISCEAMEDFSFICPGDLLKYLAKLEDQPITISVDLKTSVIQITTEDGKCKYEGVNAEEFPVIPQVNVSANIDLTLIGSFLGYCGKDELKPVMSGVNVSHSEDKGMRLCGTDAHRLKVATIEGTTIEHMSDFIVPPKAVKLLNDFKAGTCQYGVTFDQSFKTAIKPVQFIRFDVTDKLTIICRAIDGRYPNYDAVIPTEQTTFLTADRKDLLKTIDKASLFANTTTNMVTLSMNGSTRVSAEDKDYNKEIVINRPYVKTGNDLEIGLNHKFLSEILKDISTDQVTIEMSLPNRAITITQGPVKRLMMPVMLTERG